MSTFPRSVPGDHRLVVASPGPTFPKSAGFAGKLNGQRTFRYRSYGPGLWTGVRAVMDRGEAPRAPSGGLGDELGNDHGDVVGAPGGQRGLDERVTGGLGIRVRGERRGDRGVRHRIAEAVGAQEEPVAALEPDTGDITASVGPSQAPIARVSTWRIGCTAAASLVMAPESAMACASVSSRVTWRSVPRRHTYARESPMWNTRASKPTV